jgi:hypothetical protein
MIFLSHCDFSVEIFARKFSAENTDPCSACDCNKPTLSWKTSSKNPSIILLIYTFHHINVCLVVYCTCEKKKIWPDYFLPTLTILIQVNSRSLFASEQTSLFTYDMIVFEIHEETYALIMYNITKISYSLLYT